MEKKKRRWGDRKDGVLLRDLDGMHFITPLIYPNRCDNEAYIRETIDLTNMNAYLKKKNETETEFPYTMFHLIVAALVKTITLRPKMNRFIANKNFYQRNEVSMSFVVKKQFADEAAEALAVIHAKDDSDVDSIHEDLRHQILDCKDVHHEDGTIEMREMLDLGLTIDERLADGYYYSKTIRLLKTLLENPELLETPANQEVAY